MALVETHVQLSGDDVDPWCEDNNDQSESDGALDDRDGDDGDGESDGEKEKDEDGEDVDGNANAGWAEAMAKILGRKSSEGQSCILVKNKELEQTKAREREQQLERRKQVDKKRVWEMMCREKPDVVKDRETERALQRIATRGVVQLFNAVKKHQKTVDDKVKEVGGSERKKAKILSSVSKRDFISVLRKAEGGGSAAKDAAAAAEEKPAWSVLRDDFMMGATMKDWDKDSDREETEPQKSGGAEASDSD